MSYKVACRWLLQEDLIILHYVHPTLQSVYGNVFVIVDPFAAQ